MLEIANMAFAGVAIIGGATILAGLYTAALAAPGLALGTLLSSSRAARTRAVRTVRGSKRALIALWGMGLLHATLLIVVPFEGVPTPGGTATRLVVLGLIAILIQVPAFQVAARHRQVRQARRDEAIGHTDPELLEEDVLAGDNDIEVVHQHGVDPILIPGRAREKTPTEEIPVITPERIAAP